MTQWQVYASMVVSAAIVFFVVLPAVMEVWIKRRERKYALALHKLPVEGVGDKQEPEPDYDESCATCWKWRDGECHARPPTIVTIPRDDNDVDTISLWPAVKPGDWCAEYEASE